MLFTNFLAQAVAPVITARQTDRHLATRVREHTPFSTFVGQKHTEFCAHRIAL